MIKVGITGPESTGKTSLAQALSSLYKCPWVPEYARDYLENNFNYTQQDLLRIANEHWNKMNEVENKYPYVFYDTEMTVIKIWSMFKYGSVDKEIIEKHQKQAIDIYLLCDIDIPWAYDPLREHPDNREELLQLYIRDLEAEGRNYYLLSGDLNERIKKVKGILKEY